MDDQARKEPDFAYHPSPVCPNCHQWQHPAPAGRDCVNECKARGFAPVERMPARDAMADAATLTSYLIAYGNPWRMQAWPLNDVAIDWYAAKQAAHAALRAVPALRGGEGGE